MPKQMVSLGGGVGGLVKQSRRKEQREQRATEALRKEWAWRQGSLLENNAIEQVRDDEDLKLLRSSSRGRREELQDSRGILNF